MEYQITNAAGNATFFTRPSGSSGELLVPSSVVQATGAGGLNRVTYKFVKTGGNVTEPTEVIAPFPSSEKCSEELVQGCRALEFKYATETSAKGDQESQWGSYKGRLKEVIFRAWNPTAKEMQSKTVAEYAYDFLGRLRAEWNPQVSPRLETTYGYDGESHVTAVTAPGQETWAMTYGTMSRDANAGRLLKVFQAPASSSLWNGELVEKTEAPVLSGFPAEGVRLAVSNGKWTNEPVAYGYQWQDCNASGKACRPILGATNTSYVVKSTDVGDTIVADVIATNGDGSVVAASNASGLVGQIASSQVSEVALKSGSGPTGVASGPDGNVWVSQSAANTVSKITTAGSVTEYKLTSPFSCPNYITAAPEKENYLWFTDNCQHRIGKITTSGSTTAYNFGSGVSLQDIVSGPEGDLWFTMEGVSKVGKMTTSGTVNEYGLPTGSYPKGIAVGPEGNLWIADYGTSKIERMTTSGTTTACSLPSGSEPYGIVAGPGLELWFTDYGTNKVGRLSTTGCSVTEYGLLGGSSPRGIVTGVNGNIYFTEEGTSEIGWFSPSVLANWQGPYTDSSGDSNQLSVSSSGLTYPVAGPITGALAVQANGTTGYLASTSSAMGNTTSAPGVTLEAWVKPNAVNTENYQEIISKTQVAQLDIPSKSSLLRVLFGNGTSWVAGAEGGTITAGKWSHVAATYDGSVARVYLNGTLVATSSTKTGAFGAYAYPLTIGAYDYAGPTIGGYFGGSISDPAVYMEALSEAQIHTDYTTTQQATYEHEVLARRPYAYYPLVSQITEYALPSGSKPQGITNGPDSNIWYANYSTSKIGKISFPGGEAPAVQPGTTIEYNVPLEGTGLKTMTSEVVAKWAQTKDIPTEGTAIFPPDEPQGWPASNYKRATVYYLDSKLHTVNIVNPAGAISTAEYDQHGNTTRTLSADDRTVAESEGTKSAEIAKQLSTENKYNSEGTQLEETLGPEHKIKLPSGSEVQARKQVKYAYEEGAPSGGPYRLVTKTIEDALTGGKEEDKRTISKSYSGQENLGWKLHQPTSTTVAPGGLGLTGKTVYSTVTGAAVETVMPGASGAETPPAYASEFGSEGTSGGEFEQPENAAVDGSGNVWVTDYKNNRVEEFSASGTFIAAYGTTGTGNSQFKNPWGITVNKSAGDVYIADEGNSRIEELTTSGTFVRTFGSSGSGEGQLSSPAGLAVDGSGHVWVADSGNNRIEEFSSTGTYIAAYGSYGTGNGQFKWPAGIAVSGETLYVADTGNSRVQELWLSGVYKAQFGSKGQGNGQFSEPEGIGVDPTSGDLYVVDTGNSRIQKLSPTGGFLAVFGSYGWKPGKLSWPRGIAVNSSGEVYAADSGNDRIEKWVLPNPLAHNSQIVYYTSGSEASVLSCQNHPEWANLPCQTQPAHQPEVNGMPELPVTTFTYNIWDEAETTKSTSGSESRIETDAYDSAGRLTSKEMTSTTGTSLPMVTYQYNSETGLLVKQSTGSGSEEKKITSEYNKLGQLTKYTDADENTTTYEYEKEADYRLTKTTDAKGNQTLKYDETTGTVKELSDSAAGKFTAGYDTEGNITSETLPNGMTETDTLNQTGELTGLEYTKTTHCTENCKWFTDNVIPSIHGQWMSQTSTLATDNYTYDETGRLTRVQDTPAGKGCATRIYTYDTDGNRTSLTSRAPTTGGGCATEGGEIERHQYDSADRLLDPETEYDPFGDITSLPATDAGGSKLTSSYYTDGQLQSQTQAGETIGYQLDPARRTRETISTGKTTTDTINHYDGPGTSPTWTSYTSGEWARNIPGITSSLAATQQNSETPVLQIANLHGDIVATVPDSETATKLFSALDTTEYGVPTSSEPPKYSWLGAGEFPTELSSGVIAMGARSYIPQLGRFLQPDPQPGGSANAYAYTHGNPLNERDPSGEWTLEATSGGVSVISKGEGVHLEGGTGLAVGAITPPPVNQQEEETFWANPPWDQITAGYEEYEEYEEEGEEYEYVSHNSNAGKGTYVESAVLYTPIPMRESETEAKLNELARQCRAARAHIYTKAEPCMKYASLLGKALGVIKKGWRALKSAAHAAWRFVGDQTVSWSEFEARVKKIFGTGKEIFSLAKCTYELFYAKGPCGSP